MPTRLRREVGPVMVRPGVLRQFEPWLGHPAWFRLGTSLEGTRTPFPAMISEADDARMLTNIVEQGAAQALLCRLAQLPQLPVSGPVQAALAVAPTLGDALSFLVEMVARANPHLSATIKPVDGGGMVLWLQSALSGGAGDFAACATCVAVLRLVEGLAFERMDSVTLVLPDDAMDLMRPVAETLRCRVTGGGAAVHVVLPPGLAALNNPIADDALWQLFREQVQARQPSQHVFSVAAVQTLLARSLRDERVALSRGEAASRLGLADRTLSRRLAEAGTGFAELLARERQALAGELLLDPSLSLHAISDRLGFPDASTFGRAFRGWYGESPGRMRRRLMLAETR